MSVGHDNGQNRPNEQAKRTGPEGEDWNALKGDVGEIADVAVERGKHFLDSAKTQATDYVDKRKNDAAQSVADLAQSLRDATQDFQDRPNIRAFVDNAAGGLDQLADTIRERSFNEIFGDVEEVVRRRPMAVAAATMVAGFLVARFIKSSAEGIRHDNMQKRQAGPGLASQGPGRRQPTTAQASPGSAYAQGRV